MNNWQLFLANNLWLLQIFGYVLATAIIQAITSRVLTRVIAKAEKTRIIVDEALFKAISKPLLVFIWLVGLSLAMIVLASQAQGFTLFDYVPKLKKLGFVIIITWGCVRFIRNMERLHIDACIAKNKEVDKTLVHAVGQLLTISIIITSTLACMQLFGVPISGLLAFGGIGGAGIAFASKDLLANFFGGLVVYLDRPFKVGDWIRSPDKPIEGTVEYIGWRVTRIRTFDKRPLYVPNGSFLTISVENPSRMTNRRIKTNVGVRYQDADKMDVIVDDVKSMLTQHPEIDTNQTLIVNMVEFGASSLNFMVYTFTKTTNWVKFQAVQHDVFLKILAIIDSHDAECAFPTQTLYLESSTSKELA